MAQSEVFTRTKEDLLEEIRELKNDHKTIKKYAQEGLVQLPVIESYIKNRLVVLKSILKIKEG
jgi:hypothetical protein